MIECSLDKINWEEMDDDDCFYSSTEMFAEKYDLKDETIVFSKHNGQIKTYKVFVEDIGSVNYYNAIEIKQKV